MHLESKTAAPRQRWVATLTRFSLRRALTSTGKSHFGVIV
jgi:hypothetical protein